MIIKKNKIRNRISTIRFVTYFYSIFFLLPMLFTACQNAERTCRFTLSVSTDIPDGNVPIDPEIDFGKIIDEAGLPGVLDPNSITLYNMANGKPVPFGLSEDFAHGDRGRLEWVITDPSDKTFEISFQTTGKRTILQPKDYIPLVGVGDLLRYNAGEPRPVAMPYIARLIDLTGDGKSDLVGCWNYAYKAGCPWDGIICYPRVGDPEDFEFGDLVHIRYVSHADSTDFKYFSKIYMFSDFADLNHDNLIDIVYCPSGSNQLFFYLNSGKKDKGGMPIFVAGNPAHRNTDQWKPCRAVDLDKDGAIDFVIGNRFFKNINPKGWPVKLAESIILDAGIDPCFYDVDGDNKPDAVCLEEIPGEGLDNYRVVWKQNIGGDIPGFGTARPLADINTPYPRGLAAVNDGSQQGLLVNHGHFQKVSFFEQTNSSLPEFENVGQCKSVSAVMALSDQAFPYICDWDNDRDLDMIVGGGYGWPRILINEGSNERMAFTESRYILSNGEPIRITRDQVLGGDQWHDMGYTYPAFIDWDNDGLSDLMLPNETNRIFWYKNIGTAERPEFGPRLQVICDGYPDSPELRSLSANRAIDTTLAHLPYPYEEERPFLWRTGAAFADWNNDGLMDFITHDGYNHKATLFTQYRSKDGKLRLKKAYKLKLSDGRLINDEIVNRQSHWTESFRAVDWDEDGLTDLVYACAGSKGNSSIYLLKNVGTKETPLFSAPRTFCCFGEPIKVTNHGPHPWVGDLDGDNKPDILTCVEWSVYPFFSHNVLEMENRPGFTLSAPKTIANNIKINKPEERLDRLVEISGYHKGNLIAEYLTDNNSGWLPATIYPGNSVEQWRQASEDTWNKAVLEGVLHCKHETHLWNYYYDLSFPVKSVVLRLRDISTNEIVKKERINFKGIKNSLVINHNNISSLHLNDKIPKSWKLDTTGIKSPTGSAIHCKITEEIKKHPEYLILQPCLKGWYRIYIGMEKDASHTCRFWASEINTRYEIPNYVNILKKKYGKVEHKLFREYFICSADITDLELYISPGGGRKWNDTWIKYIKLIPMSPEEVEQIKHVRQMTRTMGRQFAGYMEPCTPAAYEPPSLTLYEHIRNEMKLNQVRGSTDVYVHVIRIGSNAWYHSDVVERFTGGKLTWQQWMEQGDPMVVAVEEARKTGIKIFADAGMNSTYYGSGEPYNDLTECFAREHPDLLCSDYPSCFNYRHPQVQAYITSIIRELLLKYDLDGVNLDFARWGYRDAYDVASLEAILEQVDRDRKEAAAKWGHPVIISARIDYDKPVEYGEPEPVFLAALRTWSESGLIDRIMVNMNKKFTPVPDISHYREILKDTGTELWGDLYWGTWQMGGSPNKDFRIAQSWIEQGLDGGFFYYMRFRPIEWEQMNRRLRLIDFPEYQDAALY